MLQWIKKIVLVGLSTTFLLITNSHALSSKQLGNGLSYAIPATSAAATIALQDWQGLGQMALSSAVVVGTTAGLKYGVNERRPNGACCDSFPSGHTSRAFLGSGFMNFRYGLKYSTPLYAGSIFVAYSRVQSKDHAVKDVLAGAAVGLLGSYISTTPYIKGTISISVDKHFSGILYRAIF